MNTFSPNYYRITLRVMESKHDSQRKWLEPKVASFYRPEDQLAFLPGIGLLIGGYKVITGSADVLAGILQGSGERVLIGIKNIFIGSTQAIPTGIIGYLDLIPGKKHTPWNAITVTVIGLTYTLSLTVMHITCLSINYLFFENESYFNKNKAPVAIFHGNLCAYELYPTQHCYYNAEQWLEEVYKHGSKIKYLSI